MWRDIGPAARARAGAPRAQARRYREIWGDVGRYRVGHRVLERVAPPARRRALGCGVVLRDEAARLEPVDERHARGVRARARRRRVVCAHVVQTAAEVHLRLPSARARLVHALEPRLGALGDVRLEDLAPAVLEVLLVRLLERVMVRARARVRVRVRVRVSVRV